MKTTTLKTTLGLLAAATLAASAHAQQGREHFQARTGADLVTVCSVAPAHPDYASAISFCHGFLAGAFQFYDATAEGVGRFVCPQAPYPTRSKVMADFVAWAKARPQVLQERSADALFRYLGEAFPCRK